MIIARGIIPATFLERENKFLVTARLNDGTAVQAFLADPGRLKELLLPSCTVYLVNASNPSRKTAFNMVAVDHYGVLVSLDTRVPNLYVRALLDGKFLFESKFDGIRPEFPYKDSRIDFLAWKGTIKFLIEVKSVTLVENGVALFPDAPTTRGTKHVLELTACRSDDYEPVLVFVIQRPDAASFKPNCTTDPDFTDALMEAKRSNVVIKAFTNKTFIDADMNLCMEPLSFVRLDF